MHCMYVIIYVVHQALDCHRAIGRRLPGRELAAGAAGDKVRRFLPTMDG